MSAAKQYEVIKMKMIYLSNFFCSFFFYSFFKKKIFIIKMNDNDQSLPCCIYSEATIHRYQNQEFYGSESRKLCTIQHQLSGNLISISNNSIHDSIYSDLILSSLI